MTDLHAASGAYEPMTDERRWSIIANMEAHFRRELAAMIRSYFDDICYVERNGKWEHCYRVTARELSEKVAEQERVLMGARQVPDDRLEDYNRHWTLPNWNRLMEEQGLVWSERFHSWQQRAEPHAGGAESRGEVVVRTPLAPMAVPHD